VFEMNSRLIAFVTASLIYLVAIASPHDRHPTIAAKAKPDLPRNRWRKRPKAKGNQAILFALNSCTYGTTDNRPLVDTGSGPPGLPRLSGQGSDKFFTQLKDPHQMGKQEEEEVASSLPHRKSLLESVRNSKTLGLTGLKAFRAWPTQTRFAPGIQSKVSQRRRGSAHAAKCLRTMRVSIAQSRHACHYLA